MKIVTAGVMKDLDRRTIQEYGISGEKLMESAGEGVFKAIRNHFSDDIAGGVSIVCGKGNNGGDGYVVARYLLQDGVRVSSFILGSRKDVTGDARLNLDKLAACDGRIVDITTQDDLRTCGEAFEKSGLIVDAIFGTGLISEVAGLYREVIERINTLKKPVVSIDIPSGIHADTGMPLGCAVKAELTVTMGLPKMGHVLYPGVDYTGDLEVVDIGIPRPLVESAPAPYTLVDGTELSGIFPRRRRGSHKGDYGHLLVLSGSVGKTGAAALAARAAVRTGSGLVTLGVPRSIYPIIASKLDEAMPEPLPETSAGTISTRAGVKIKRLLEGKDALAIGPGLSTHTETRKLVRALVERVKVPMVIDADGINNISGSLKSLGKTRAPRVLTPHPGEMSRLTGTPVQAVQKDRIGAAGDFARRYGVILVLKGARTVIAAPDGTLSINSSGNPGMASGGMGDILTGIIGSLLAQGIAPYDAARVGVFLHGWAADRVAEELGEAGMAASDLLDKIPLGIRTLTRASS